MSSQDGGNSIAVVQQNCLQTSIDLYIKVHQFLSHGVGW
jgi:hypothetical protein